MAITRLDLQPPRREAKAITMSADARLFFDMVGNVPSTKLALGNAYRAYALAYACMQYRATKLIEPPLMVVRETEDGEEWLPDHPLSVLLDAPNPDMSLADLLETTSLYLDERGLCVWHKVKDRLGITRRLYPYPRDQVSIRSMNGLLFGQFTLQTDSGAQTVGPEDVVVFRRIDPRDPLGSLGPLQVALDHAGIGHDMRRAIQSVLQRQIRPGAVFSAEQGFGTDSEFEMFKQRLGDYQGSWNAGKPLFLEKVKLDLLQQGLKDLALGEVNSDVEAAVCQVFQVHPALIAAKIGLVEASAFSDTLEPAQSLFYDLCAIPTWTRLATTLTRSLLRDTDPDTTHLIRFDTSKVRALQADLTKRTTEASQAASFWTVNEARLHTNQEPLDDSDERGDQFVAQLASAATPDASNAADGELQPTTNGNGNGKAHHKADDRVRFQTLLLLEAHARELQEAHAEHTASELLHGDQEAVEAALTAGKANDERPITKPEADALVKRLLGVLEQREETWTLRFRPVLASIAKASVQQAAASIGVRFDVLEPGLLAFADREAAEMLTHVSETTRDEVKRAVQSSLANGSGAKGVTQALQASGTFSKARAKLIGVTEVTRARNGASRERMLAYAERTGLPVTKRWVNSRDAKVRDAHKDAPVGVGLEVRPIAEPFSNGLQEPSEPNCRCALQFTVEA